MFQSFPLLSMSIFLQSVCCSPACFFCLLPGFCQERCDREPRLSHNVHCEEVLSVCTALPVTLWPFHLHHLVYHSQFYFIFNIHHVMCWGWAEMTLCKQLQHRWKIPFLWMKQNHLLFIFLQCEINPFSLTEKNQWNSPFWVIKTHLVIHSLYARKSLMRYPFLLSEIHTPIWN